MDLYQDLMVVDMHVIGDYIRIGGVSRDALETLQPDDVNGLHEIVKFEAE